MVPPVVVRSGDAEPDDARVLELAEPAGVSLGDAVTRPLDVEIRRNPALAVRSPGTCAPATEAFTDHAPVT